MADNRPVEAEKILDKLTEQHDSLTLLHAALGQAQVKAGQTNDGVATLKHAVTAVPAQRARHDPLRGSADESRAAPPKRTPYCSTCSTTSRRRPSRSG